MGIQEGPTSFYFQPCLCFTCNHLVFLCLIRPLFKARIIIFTHLFQVQELQGRNSTKRLGIISPAMLSPLFAAGSSMETRLGTIKFIRKYWPSIGRLAPSFMWNESNRAQQNSTTSKKPQSIKLLSQEGDRIKVIWLICIRNTNNYILCFQYIYFPNLSSVAYSLLTGVFNHNFI